MYDHKYPIMRSSYEEVYTNLTISSTITHPQTTISLSLVLTSPPLKPPTRMLEIVRPKVSLDNRPEVDIQNPWVSVCARAFRPFEVSGAAAHCDVVSNLRSGAG